MSLIKKPIIIFDVDGTLVVESTRLHAQAQAVAYHFGSSHKAMQAVLYAFFKINDELAQANSPLKNNIPVYMKMMGQRLGIETDEDEAAALARVWTQAYENDHSKPELFPDTAMCLETLTKRGFTLVIASGNTVASRLALLKQTGIAHYFKHIFAAQDVGYQKQDVRFWEAIFSDLNIINGEKVMVVGNQLNDDIVCPITLGHFAFLIDRPTELKKNKEKPIIPPTSKFANLMTLVHYPMFS